MGEVMKHTVANKVEMKRGSLNGKHFGVLALVLGVSSAFANETQHPLVKNVLVIDEGVDLSHAGFSKTRFVYTGRPEDGQYDKAGFPRNVSGWNMISDDALYFPGHVLNKFKANAAQLKQAFYLYSMFEKGDANARNQIRQNQQLQQLLDEYLGLSHGTHVAGIVTIMSEKTTKIESVNVFTSSKETQRRSFSWISIKDRLKRMKPLAPRPLGTSSVYDTKDSVQKLVQETTKDDLRFGGALTRYVRASGFGVANLSLGTSMVDIQRGLEGIWQQEMVRQNKDPFTKRSAEQQANFIHARDTIFRSSQAVWERVFADNPNTLFVVAAGNDGDSRVQNAGNNDVNFATPANSSARFANVITVAAATKEGVITDFSNYGIRTVNIGAWGHAVPSYAPNNMAVAMSGTSMASPYVAGVAAKVRLLNPRLTAAQVRSILERTAFPVASMKGKTTTGGIIDPQKAYAAATGAATGGLEQGIKRSSALRSNQFSVDILATTRALADIDLTAGVVAKTDDLLKQFIR